MKRYENIEHKLCTELDKLDKKYGTGAEMTPQELETLRMIYSTLKSREMYYGMKEAEEWDDEEASGEMDARSGRRDYGRDGRSYRRGRDAMGRYISREMGMPDGYSGHYPEMMPMYYPRY